MAVIHISETEAVRDFAAVLAHVRAGSEVVIDSEHNAVALLVPPAEAAAVDPDHDAWFRAQVQEALDDPHPGIPSEEVEAHFARRRAASLLKLAGNAG
jgi:antitoxin (DNA-binding transcriptional repressor) of toxin-antitoxin stability system